MTTSTLHSHGQGTPRLAAIILAGSQRWGHVDARALGPRMLADIALRPLISYPLEWVWAAGVCEITISVNGASTAVRNHLGDRYGGIDLHYRSDLLPRGAAGCLRDAAVSSDADTLLVVEASVIPRISPLRVVEEHMRSGADLTVVTRPAAEAPDELTPAGIYVVSRRALEFIAPTGFQDIKETLVPRLFRAGATVATFPATHHCPRVTTVESYLAVNRWLVEQCAADGTRSDDGDAHATIMADPSAAIAPDALLVGPVLIGPRAVIAARATIVGPTVIGADTVVGASALVSRSVVGRECSIAEHSAVHASVVGDRGRTARRARVYGRLATSDVPRRSWLQALIRPRPGAWPSAAEPAKAGAPDSRPRRLAADVVRTELL